MQFDIKSRWTGETQFSCELSAEIAGKSYGFKLGFAVKKAVEAGADLTGADLTGADLTRADLTRADLTRADLTRADLTRANLTRANLTRADLTDADLTRADLTGAIGVTAPVIPNIDDTILAAIESPGCSLEMGAWHTCGTTHCRAGWAIHLAGDAGRMLEERIGPSAAAALIYHASAGYVPNFYASNQAAMDDIRAHAALQRGSDAT